MPQWEKLHDRLATRFTAEQKEPKGRREFVLGWGASRLLQRLAKKPNNHAETWQHFSGQVGNRSMHAKESDLNEVGTTPDIAIFGSYPHSGGVPRRLTNVIKVWVEMGLRVELVSFRDGVCFYPDEVAHLISFVDLGTRSKWTTQVALWGYVRKVRPRVILSTAHLANTILGRLRRLPGVRTRCFVSVPNTFGQSRKRAGRKLDRKLHQVRRLYDRADGVIAISRGVENDLVKNIGISNVPVHCIFNGSVTEENSQRAQELVNHSWLSSPSRVPVVLTVGRLAPQKDQMRLIDAVGRIRREKPVRLIILGDGPLRTDLWERAEQHGEAREWLSMPGFVDNPYSWMARADVFVLCSLWEGFPNVLAEAMGLGVPVVATDCPSGPADILENGRYGHLVPIEDTDALDRAICRVLDGDYPKFDVERAVSEFTAETAAARYLEVFGLLASDKEGHS